MRNRHYLDRMGRKKCNEELVQKEMCAGTTMECLSQDEVSEVGPCGRSSERGVRVVLDDAY